MHKIKEMLHKDSEDNNTLNNNNNNESTKEKIHDLIHDDDKEKSSKKMEHGGEKDIKRESLKMSGEQKLKEKKEKVKDESMKKKKKKKNKMKEGEHLSHQHEHHHHHGEKHIIHDREALKEGGNLYKAGVDPIGEREVLEVSKHEGGVKRERIEEGKVVKETVKEVELHKVQPVIHRDREQKEIRHVVEPHKKVEIKDTEIHHRERDIDLGVRREGSTLETSRSIGHAPHIESSREYLGKERQHQELPAKVEEHVHRKVEEHVHPVIYKEVLKPKVTEETHHIYEKVKEAPVETYEVKEIERSRGEGLREAEREFFARESSRGIVLGEGHSCECDIERHGHKHAHSHEHSQDISKHGEHIHSHTGGMMAQEPIIGHHQNIGAHHLPAGAVPAGHNMAYDAALAQNSGGVISHGTRDVERMEKMKEKKIEKAEDSSASSKKNVSVV